MKNCLLKSLMVVLMLSAFAVGVSSCKAWRTISTTATYVQQNDSTTGKASATITTKTVEEYQGVKKN
jgi:hypothetical protein